MFNVMNNVEVVFILVTYSTVLSALISYSIRNEQFNKMSSHYYKLLNLTALKITKLKLNRNLIASLWNIYPASLWDLQDTCFFPFLLLSRVTTYGNRKERAVSGLLIGERFSLFSKNKSGKKR